MSEVQDFCPKCGSEFACMCSPRTRKLLREQTADALRADPTWTSRQLAEKLHTTHRTVESVRKELIANGEIPHCTTKGKDGRFWQRIVSDDREPDDFYSTDPRAILALLDRVKLVGSIWECACGQGHISKFLEKWPNKVISTDLRHRGYGEGGVDFLRTWIPDGLGDFADNIVTNPPFKLHLEFAEHAIEVIRHKVCLLLPLYFLESEERAKLFRVHPPRFVYVFSKRLSCGRGVKVYKSGTIPMAWYVWDKSYKGDTTLKWI